jgi:hypothetical protein
MLRAVQRSGAAAAAGRARVAGICGGRGVARGAGRRRATISTAHFAGAVCAAALGVGGATATCERHGDHDHAVKQRKVLTQDLDAELQVWMDEADSVMLPCHYSCRCGDSSYVQTRLGEAW